MLLLCVTAYADLNSGLVGYWKLNETSGATRVDSVGGNNLTDHNTVGSSSGKISNAADFVSASSRYLSAADATAFQMGTGDFTWAVWIKFSTFSSQTAMVYTQSNVRGWGLLISSGNIFASIATTTDLYTSATNTFNDGSWHLAVATYDRTGNTMTLYVDNAVEGTKDISAIAGETVNDTAPLGYGFKLGADVRGGNASLFFDGSLDEFGLWNRVLTSQDRSDLWNGGAGQTLPLPSPTPTASPTSTPTATATATPSGSGFYVDPDWTGSHSGAPTQPWTVLDATAWTTINSALAASDVTVYFSSLKANGTTQQSKAWYIHCQRTDYSSHRLTLDGYSKYNSNETTANWLANPDSDINHAYLNGKVFQATGDGSQAIGWDRRDGGDLVTRNGLIYFCIESHLASSDKEPGVGANWHLYWDQHGTSGSPWSSGTSYLCHNKQNYITIRGFDVTGTGARAAFWGSNFVYEYNYVHDITGIGPGVLWDYPSFPDSSLAQMIAAPSSNITFHHFTVKNSYGEGLYIGAMNPDSPSSFQLNHGNQVDHMLIEDFLIDRPGVNGGQGDAIDCKNGITNLTVRLGEIKGMSNSGNGINVPMTATNVNQNILIERNYIHDPLLPYDGFGGEFGIYAATDQVTAPSLYGYNGVTIRNNIIANCRRGIQYSGDTVISRPATFGYIYNNTVYATTADNGIGVATNVSGCVVENNFVFGGTDPQGFLESTGVTSDYNAHDGSWTSSSEGAHTLTLTSPNALLAVVDAPGGNFNLKTGTTLIGAAVIIGSFSDDYAGTTRTNPWDIGAYKYGGTPTPTPTASPTPTATATATPTPTPVQSGTPTAPTGLQVVPTTTLQWNANPVEESVTQYGVYRVKHGGADLVDTVTTTADAITDFLNAKRTRFYVTAINANGESARSTIVTIQQR